MIELILEGVDRKGNKLLSIVALNAVTRNAQKFIEAHIVTSIYGRRSIDKYIGKAEEEGRLIYNKKEELTQGISQVQYEGNINANSSLETTLSQPDNGVKRSDRDPDAERVAEVLQKENAKLKEDVNYLKELLKLQKSVTHGKLLTRSSVEAAAGHLMNVTKARGEKAELVKLLNSFYEYIAAGEFLTWDGVIENAQPAIKWLQDHIVEKKQIDEYSAGIFVSKIKSPYCQ